jgi:hypothetical protein
VKKYEKFSVLGSQVLFRTADSAEDDEWHAKAGGLAAVSFLTEKDWLAEGVDALLRDTSPKGT